MYRLSLLLAVSCVPLGLGADWPSFRGPKRDNLSPDKGLLRDWPMDGPKQLWKATGVGEGFSSVTLAEGKLFTMGTADGKAFIHAIDASKGGSPLWSSAIGKGGNESYKGTRCTPTYDDGRVYGLGAFGDLACVSAKDGKILWSKNLLKDYGGSYGGWQYAESPLIDGERVVFTPGGSKALMVCLNKKTGKEIWRTAGGKASGPAGYSSIVISNAGGVKQYITLVGKGTIGVHAQTGKLLWHYDKFQDNTANIPTNIVLGNQVLTVAGYDRTASLLTLTKGRAALSVKEEWSENRLRNKHGGVLVVGDRMFGDTDDSGSPYAAKWKTGETVWKKARGGKGSGSASMTYADGCLYVRYENGWMALVDATADEYRELGGFKIPEVRGPSWAHPVVIGGRLYLREGDAVLCYDVKAE
jgi:outer membrane protein assembly factor BamB